MLASRADVAAALGLDHEADLTDVQVARVDGLLERASAAVAREAGRQFGAGPVVVGAVVVDGRVYVPDRAPASAVTVMDGDGVELTVVDGTPGWVAVRGGDGCPIPTGCAVTVAYERLVPAVVPALVAAVVARHLMVAPEESKAAELTAGPFRWRAADWVSSTAVLTEDERGEARALRSRIPNVIVHRVGGRS